MVNKLSARNTSFACAKIVGMKIADVQDQIDHELISKADIHKKINEVAAQASEDYRGKDPLLVAVLKGAVNTMVAFSQAMSIPVQMDFMSLSSYGSARLRFVRICPRMYAAAMCSSLKTSWIPGVRSHGWSRNSSAAVHNPWRSSRCWRSRPVVKSTCR